MDHVIEIIETSTIKGGTVTKSMQITAYANGIAMSARDKASVNKIEQEVQKRKLEINKMSDIISGCAHTKKKERKNAKGAIRQKKKMLVQEI